MKSKNKANINFDEDKSKDYWEKPENQYPGFVKMEELMIELKEDYHHDNNNLSELILKIQKFKLNAY